MSGKIGPSSAKGENTSGSISGRLKLSRFVPSGLSGRQQPTGKGASKAAPVRQESAVVKFVRDTRSELRKVVWPTRQEAVNLTVLVVIASVAVGLLMGLFDFGFKSLFELILR